MGRFTCVLLLGYLWAHSHTLVTSDVIQASLRGVAFAWYGWHKGEVGQGAIPHVSPATSSFSSWKF